MSTIRTSSFWVTMAAVFALSTGALAATPATEEHDAHHPAQEQAEAVSPDVSGATMPMPMRMQAMQERMKMMREARDPQDRMRMMEEQMADIDTAMKGMADCPMMSGDMPMGRMGMGGEGMMRQQGGMGMMQRRGEAMHDGGMMMRHHPGMMQQHGEMMGKRLDSMEKRLDLMQSIIESHMARRGRMTQ